jgi:hypothetical protein
MPSFTTFFRAIVMLVVGVVGFKGWQMYGPPTDQVKSAAMRAVDFAQAAWKNFQSTDKPTQQTVQPQAPAPPFVQTLQPPAADVAVAPPLSTSTQSLSPNPPIGSIPSTSAPAPQTPVTPLAATSPASGAASANDDRVKALVSRLEQLGGADPKVSSWGSGGHLYRCCCQAPLGNSPAVTQHFESVAAEPALAVEQVVAKVEAWRTAQRGGGVMRY